MNSTSGSDDQFPLPKTTSFFPNSLFNKNRKAKGCAIYAFAYCHKPAMTTHQIFHISEHNYILCLIMALIYQPGYISCSVMRCVGASQEQTMAVTKHLFSFRKPRNWKHLFSDPQHSNLTSFSPLVHISIIQYGCMPPNIPSAR